MDQSDLVWNVVMLVHRKVTELLSSVQTSPISFASHVPLPREAKEIGDVCTQATELLIKLNDKWEYLYLEC